jgi:hypothetical protein
MIIMAWPCKKNGKSKDTEKGIRSEIYRKETYGTTQKKIISDTEIYQVRRSW